MRISSQIEVISAIAYILILDASHLPAYPADLNLTQTLTVNMSINLSFRPYFILQSSPLNPSEAGFRLAEEVLECQMLDQTKRTESGKQWRQC